MDSEKRCHERAAPASARHSIPEAEEQQGIEQVQTEIGEMMPGWMRAVELAISHMREPSQRMPEIGVGSLESPADVLPGQPREHMWIGRDVFVIIVIDEVETQHRPRNDEREKRQPQANQTRRPEGFGSVHRLAETETFPSRADFASRQKPSRRCVWAATSFAGQYTASVAATSTSAPKRLEPGWPPRHCRVSCISPTAFVRAFCESCMARHYSRPTDNSEPKSAVSAFAQGQFMKGAGTASSPAAQPSPRQQPGTRPS